MLITSDCGVGNGFTNIYIYLLTRIGSPIRQPVQEHIAIIYICRRRAATACISVRTSDVTVGKVIASKGQVEPDNPRVVSRLPARMLLGN